LLADGLLERENDQALPQTSEQHRWPILVVPNLDCDDAPGGEQVDFCFEVVRVCFDLVKRSRDFTTRIEDGRRILCAREDCFPRGQQCVVRFHRLREHLSAPKLRARF
jgi:hypothetical protein